MSCKDIVYKLLFKLTRAISDSVRFPPGLPRWTLVDEPPWWPAWSAIGPGPGVAWGLARSIGCRGGQF